MFSNCIHQVKKNRFSGDLGTVPFKFDAESRSIRELSDSELDKFGIYDAYHRTVSLREDLLPQEALDLSTKEEETHQELEDTFSKQTDEVNTYTGKNRFCSLRQCFLARK